MIECRADGVEFLRFAALAEQPLLSHAVFTRRGGVSAAPFDTLNASSATGDEVAAVRENKRRMARVLALDLASATPVHGARVAAIEAPGAYSRSLARDAPRHRGRRHDDRRAWHRASSGRLATASPSCSTIRASGRWRWCMPDGAARHRAWQCAPLPRCARATARARRTCSRESAPSIGKCCYTLTVDDREQFRADSFIWAHTPFERSPRPDGARIYAVIRTPTARNWWRRGSQRSRSRRLASITAAHTDRFYSNRIERSGTGRFGVGIGLLAGGDKHAASAEAWA